MNISLQLKTPDGGSFSKGMKCDMDATITQKAGIHGQIIMEFL
jgi:hypothetical protein